MIIWLKKFNFIWSNLVVNSIRPTKPHGAYKILAIILIISDTHDINNPSVGSGGTMAMLIKLFSVTKLFKWVSTIGEKFKIP